MKIRKNIAVSDSGLVFNPENGESFSVNPIGVELTSLMREGKSFDEISNVILKKYNAEKQVFEKDFQEFLETLSSYGLLDKDEKETA
jgi:hypothetical protein